MLHLFLLLAGLLVRPAAAQSPTPLIAHRQVLVDADHAMLSEIGRLLPYRGGLIATQYREGIIRSFSSNGTLTSLGRPGEGPGEFRMPTLAGVLADTLWISDVGLRRITLFRPDRSVLRTIPWPATDRAITNGVRWEMLLPLGYRADGSMVVEAMHAPAMPRPAWANALQVFGGIQARRR